MQRRSGSGQPTKVRRGEPKARKAPTARASTADLQDQLDRRTRELEEASGHVNRTDRPNTWLHRPMLQREKSSCQPGAVHTWPIA